MQTKIIDSNFDTESGITTVTIRTPYGDFVGIADFNDEKDKFHPSNYVGSEIAEARANIEAINEVIKRKKEQLKGLKRLEYSCKMPKGFYRYINHCKKGIQQEISDLREEKEFFQNKIKVAIEARCIFIRSRSISKEDKEKYLEGLGAAIKQLGQNSSKDKK